MEHSFCPFLIIYDNHIKIVFSFFGFHVSVSHEYDLVTWFRFVLHVEAILTICKYGQVLEIYLGSISSPCMCVRYMNSMFAQMLNS